MPGPIVLDIHTCFAAALKVAKECNPARTPPTGTRKRLRQTHAYNLITRHSENRGGCCASSPICARSVQGVGNFASIRSFLSTLRKASADICKSRILTFQGSPPMPRLAPE